MSIDMMEPHVPTAAAIKKKWAEIVDDMLDVRRNYWLNHSYFLGDQWIQWDDSAGRVDVLEFGSNADADVRVTVNKFKPRTMGLLARFTQTPLEFEPRPQGVDQDAVRRASLQRQVLEIEAHRSDWEQVRADNVLNTMLGAVAAISVEPDWEYAPDPVPLIETGDAIRLPSRPSVKLTALSAAEFGLEPGTRDVKDARWWMRCTTLSPEQAQDRYQLEKAPSPDADASTFSVMHRALISRRSGRQRPESKMCLVYIYYERPSWRSPGCVAHVIGDKIVQCSPWPFPFKEHLNLALTVQTPVGSNWRGDTLLNDARQLQRNYNKAFTSINAHIGKADNARLILPMGAVLSEEDDLTGDVGEVIRVDPNVGDPHWMLAPQIPRWLREHIEKLEMEMDDLFSTHQVSRGIAPGDRNSGLALSILAEKDETPLGPMSKSQQRAWQKVAEMTLATMKHLMHEIDEVMVPSGQGPMRVEDVLMDGDYPTDVVWTAEDLPDSPIVRVPLESVMPRSQAAIQDVMLRLAGAFPALFQDMTPGQLAAVLRTPDVTAFATVKDPQVSLADWENSRMIAGVGDTEVMVDDWHDHTKHIKCHNDMRASAAYRHAAPEVQDYIDTHIAIHAKFQAELEQAAAVAQQPAPDQQPDMQPQEGMPVGN